VKQVDELFVGISVESQRAAIGVERSRTPVIERAS
jgi:hypothetical protein